MPMLLGMAGCTEEYTPGEALNAEVKNAIEPDDEPYVYLLSDAPEKLETWESLGATFERRTGTPVSVVSAKPEEYSVTLQAEMIGERTPTIFLLTGTDDAAAWDDYTLPLRGTAVGEHLRYSSRYLFLDGKTVGVPDGNNGNFFAINAQTNEAAIDASLRFLSWVLSSPEGRSAFPEKRLGAIYR